MNQNNAMLMVVGLTLALVAVLAIAPVLNDEMAYASPGGTGGSGSTSNSVACNPPQTCSAGTFPEGGGGFVACSAPGGLNNCAGSFATGNAGGNGGNGGIGPGGNGGGGGNAFVGGATAGDGQIGFAFARGGAGGAGGAPGGP
jgi:hypothetical protein